MTKRQNKTMEKLILLSLLICLGESTSEANETKWKANWINRIKNDSYFIKDELIKAYPHLETLEIQTKSGELIDLIDTPDLSQFTDDETIVSILESLNEVKGLIKSPGHPLILEVDDEILPSLQDVNIIINNEDISIEKVNRKFYFDKFKSFSDKQELGIKIIPKKDMILSTQEWGIK